MPYERGVLTQQNKSGHVKFYCYIVLIPIIYIVLRCMMFSAEAGNQGIQLNS